jgi:hypothetical protein
MRSVVGLTPGSHLTKAPKHPQAELLKHVLEQLDLNEADTIESSSILIYYDTKQRIYAWFQPNVK